MDVGIGGQDILIKQAVPAPMDAQPPRYLKYRITYLLPIRDVGVMKLVTMKDFSCGVIGIRGIHSEDRVSVTVRASV